MTAGAKTKLQVDGVISIRFNKQASSERTNSPKFVARKTALIFNSPFEYDVIETFVWAHEELVYSIHVHEHDRLDFGMLTVETAVFDCIC